MFTRERFAHKASDLPVLEPPERGFPPGRVNRRVATRDAIGMPGTPRT